MMMLSQNGGCSVGCPKRHCLPLVMSLSTLVYLLACSLCLGVEKAPDKARSSPAVVGLLPEKVGRLESVVKGSGLVAVLSFESSVSEWLGTADGKSTPDVPVLVPNTVWTLVDKEGSVRSHFTLDGEFGLVSRILGKVPPLGKVKRTWENMPRPTEQRSLASASPILDMAEAYRGAKPRGRELFVVVGPKDAKDVLECNFTGPIYQNEVPYVEGLVRFLEGDRPFDAKQERGRLTDRNPALVMLALRRLESLGDAGPKDFALAVSSVPREYVVTMLKSGLDASWGNAVFAKEFFEQLKQRAVGLDQSRKTLIQDNLRANMASSDNPTWNLAILSAFPELTPPAPAKPGDPAPAGTSSH